MDAGTAAVIALGSAVLALYAARFGAMRAVYAAEIKPFPTSRAAWTLGVLAATASSTVLVVDQWLVPSDRTAPTAPWLVFLAGAVAWPLALRVAPSPLQLAGETAALLVTAGGIVAVAVASWPVVDDPLKPLLLYSAAYHTLVDGLWWPLRRHSRLQSRALVKTAPLLA